jgi:hypothetical protein
MKLKMFLPSSVVTIALAVCSMSVMAQHTYTLHTGRTSVKLSSTFTNALTDLDVSVGRVFSTEIEDGAVTFL